MEIDLGDGYRVREWHETDIPSLVRYANNRNVWINLRDRMPHPYTEDDARAWLERCASAERQTSFAIATGDEAIGGIGVELGEDVYTGTAEIGYWLGEPFWGRGTMTRAARAFTDWAFVEFGLRRISAEVFAWNPASCRVLEKAGYELEGRVRSAIRKDGVITDALMYASVR